MLTHYDKKASVDLNSDVQSAAKKKVELLMQNSVT